MTDQAAQTSPSASQFRAAAERIFGPIASEMARVEAEFHHEASSNIPEVDRLNGYLRSSGGKRLRPALLILAAYAAGGDGASDNSIRMGAVVEMLHTATLVHDDIIDNADTRRGRESFNHRFGNHAAVLMGDWLYMSAFETSLRERSLDILDILTAVTRKMTEGELIQLTVIGDVGITEEQYFDILRRKTAFLFSACCEIGAILAGANADERTALRDYGLDLGIAFQLADDLLDLTADGGELGKAVGADVLEGKLTLPLIMLCRTNPDVRTEVQKVMASGSYPDGSRERLTHLLIETGSMDEMRRIANGYADAARKNLEVLPESKYSLVLREIPTFVIERNR